MGEGRMHVWEQEVYGKSLYLPLNLAVSLKLLLKNCLKKKKLKKIHVKFWSSYMNEPFLS